MRSRSASNLWAFFVLTLLFAVGVGQRQAVAQKVYWTDRDNATLSVTDLSSGQTQVLVTNTGGRLQDVDLDASTGILYFSDWGPVGPPGSQGSISQVNSDGTGLAPVCAPGTLGDAVHQLALDPVNSQVYFTRAVSYDNHEISRVNYGPGCGGYTVFLSGGFRGPGWFPSGLAHDPGNNLLYWGDPGILDLPPNGSVNRMTDSGGAQVQLTPHIAGRGRGFALDQASQTIFLTAHNPMIPGSGGAVFAYDIALDTETQIIGDDPDTGYWDIEIDPIGQRIWYTAPAAGEIRSAKFDGSDVQVELSGLTNPYGLALELESCEPVEDPDVRTQGFWKRVCAGQHPSGEHENLPGYVDCVNLTDTFADVDDVDALCDRLQPSPPNDKCEQAEAQFMALLLNVCSGRVAECNCTDDPDVGPATVGEVIVFIDDLLSNPDRTFDDCVLAQSIADLINNGLTLVDCR